MRIFQRLIDWLDSLSGEKQQIIESNASELQDAIVLVEPPEVETQAEDNMKSMMSFYERINSRRKDWRNPSRKHMIVFQKQRQLYNEQSHKWQGQN